jgi:hypothetical protein
MSRPPVLLCTLAAILALSACSREATTDNSREASAPPAADAGDIAAPPAMPDDTGPCNADAVQSLIGQEATEAVLEQARTDSGATTVRALKPGEPATMDFRTDRLDIALDDAGVIQSLRCG